MHELSLCAAVADIVARRAAGRRVTVVHLRVGQLRQVVPDTLAFCWTMLTADTELDGSLIEVQPVPATLECRACGAMTGLSDSFLIACSACGGAVDVRGGEEFDVVSLDLVRG